MKKQTIRDLVKEIIEAQRLVHVTHIANVQSILQQGLFSPLRARTVGAKPGIGAEGSNESVVQLFDYTNLDLKASVEQLKNFREESPALESRCAMIVIDEAVRESELFRHNLHVQRVAAGRSPSMRYYPHTESWFDADVLGTQNIVQVWELAPSYARSLFPPSHPLMCFFCGGSRQAREDTPRMVPRWHLPGGKSPGSPFSHPTQSSDRFEARGAADDIETARRVETYILPRSKHALRCV